MSLPRPPEIRPLHHRAGEGRDDARGADEIDVIDDHIRFHLDHGIDFVVVTDNLSVDGTSDVLRADERSGVARVMTEVNDDYRQSKWVTRMTRLAHSHHDADEVVHSDADELSSARATTG